MKLQIAIALFCFQAAMTIAVGIGLYSIGKSDGMTFGYAQGMSVAEAWKQRAKQCEGQP